MRLVPFGKHLSILKCFLVQKHLNFQLPFQGLNAVIGTLWFFFVCLFLNMHCMAIQGQCSKSGGGCDGPGDFEVTLPRSQISVQSRGRTKYTRAIPHSWCTGREKARQARVLIESEMQVVFRGWHLQADEQRYLAQPHSPARGIALCPRRAGCPHWLVFDPESSHSTGVSAKGQVLLVQLDGEEKRGWCEPLQAWGTFVCFL